MRLGTSIGIAILLAVFLLPSMAFADDRVEANKLFVQAARFIRQADNMDDPVLALELYNEALGLLEEIEIKYPGTDLAVKIVSYQKIGAISRDEIEKKIANSRYTQEARVTQSSTSPKRPMTPQIASSSPVVVSSPQPQRPIVISKAIKSEIDLSGRTWFARFGVGYSKPAELDLKSKAGAQGEVDLTGSPGVELAFGRNFGSTRFEFELARRNFDIGYAEGLTRPNFDINDGSVRESGDPFGDVAIYNSSINGFYEWQDKWFFNPYVGAGLGAAYIKANDIKYGPGGQSTFDGHMWVPSGSLMAGLSVPLSNSADLDLGYKFIAMGDFVGARHNFSGRTDMIKIHNFMAGLRYYFGE